MNLRQIATDRYEASAWFRLALVVGLTGFNLAVLFLAGVFFPDPGWFGASLVMLWILLLAGFATWLVTWH